jgi:hypothetical protein
VSIEEEEEEDYGIARQATGDNSVRCWISKVRDTNTECILLTTFHGKSDYANAPKCYFYMYIACLVLNALCFIDPADQKSMTHAVMGV